MHPENAHQGLYDIQGLVAVYPSLKPHIITNTTGLLTIDFEKPKAVYALNKALLSKTYKIKDWSLPEGYLCPPIPGRADYIHHIADLILKKNTVKGLDIGTGANAIYPLLGHAIFNWKMVASETIPEAVESAVRNTKDYTAAIEIRSQETRSQLFKGIIKEGEYYDFTMCNPPFYASEAEAMKANQAKQRNLKLTYTQRNFSGQANELWCNGGEALFVKRLIKESVLFKEQVGWFTCLLSQKQNLPKAIKQLNKLKAAHKIVLMEQGNKQSRFLAWQFSDTTQSN